jgi:galactose mutarotase-like enzyme
VPDRSNQWVSFTSGALTAAVDPLGAQLSLFRDAAGLDLLWNGDPAFWSGRAPLLFPIVGELAGGRYRLGTTSYQLARHGFARRSAFEVVESTATSAAFRLRADDATSKVYPFRFELQVEFELRGLTLGITTWIRNEGDQEMPASFGYHPAFCWPLPYGQPRAAHFIEFAVDEPSPIRSLDANGLMTPERHTTPIVQRRLALEDSLFQHDALIFDEVRSPSVTYGAQAGPRIRVSYPDAPYLGVWSKPGANFICIEPWHGIADPQGYAGDFTAKPGIFRVAAGATLPIKVAITLVP